MSMPKVFWKVVANILCVVVYKPNGMDDIKCIQELANEPQCTFSELKKKKVLLITDSYATRSLNHVGRG